jgi:thioredoxin
MLSKTLKPLDDSNFEAEVLASELPYLVDFGAAWCAPCRTLTPVVEGIAADHAGRLRVGSFDADAGPRVATQYRVRSLPTLLLFHRGQVVGQLVGAVRRSKIEEMLAKVLAAPQPQAQPGAAP